MTVYHMGLRRNIGSLVVWFIIFGGLLAVAMAIYPTLGGESLATSAQNLFSSSPQILVEVLGLGNYKILTTLIGYFAFVFQFIMLFSMLFAAILGAKTVTTEEGCGATEFLLAQPISRKSIARQKLASAIVTYFIYSLLISAVALTMAYIFHKGSMLETALDMLPVLLGFFFCGIIYIAIGFFFSSFLRSNGESIPIMVAVVLITYILGLMGNIVSRVWFLSYASPIQYGNSLLMVQSSFNWIQIGIGVLLIILPIIAGMGIYKKKNFYL